jgi:hypothetical protein
MARTHYLIQSLSPTPVYHPLFPYVKLADATWYVGKQKVIFHQLMNQCSYLLSWLHISYFSVPSFLVNDIFFGQ